MGRMGKPNKGQSVQFLFVMVLFFVLAICALFTVSFGAKVYENIEARMQENFTGITPLAYVSNKVKQADESGAISVVQLENTSVLAIRQVFDDTVYMTYIYHQDGFVKELFVSLDSQFQLADGLPVMEGEGLSFEIRGDRLLQVKTGGESGGTLLLALRSEGGKDEQE